MKKTLTKIAQEYETQGVTLDALVNAMIAAGLITDINTITDKGVKYGLSYFSYEADGKTYRNVVYSESMQARIAKSLDTIKEKYSSAPSASVSSSNVTAKSISAIAKETGLSRNDIESWLIGKGYIADISHPTQLGIDAGIVTKNFRGNDYLAYGAELQKQIADAAKEISESAAKEVLVDKNESIKYPYLGLDEFVIVDTETTGLEHDDEIIEFAVVSMTGEELFHSYFYPDKEVNEKAQEVNHLSKAKLAQYPRFIDKIDEIKAAVKGRKIMGHNIPFDKRVTLQTLAKQGYVNADAVVNELFMDMIDTKPLAKKWLNSKSYSLNNLTTLIGITREEQHDATDDCRMTLEFVNRLEDIITIRKEYDFVKC